MEKALLSSGGGGGCSKVRDNGASAANWESSGGNNFKYDKDYPYGYPWPPRYYTCSFCQREFKSAQALGGHMNIHRRDRARLRDQSSPNNSPVWGNNNSSSDQNPNSPNPNPNPNYHNSTGNNFASSTTTSPTNNNNIYAHQYSLVSLSLSSLPPSTKNGEKLGGGGGSDPVMGSSDEFGREFQGVGKWKDFSSLENHQYHHQHRHQDHDHEVRVLKSSSSSTSTKEHVKLDLELCLGEAKEDLDLELRLGI